MKNITNNAQVDIPLIDQSAFDRRLRSRRRIINSFEAKANNNRSLSERIADVMTMRFGSMVFLVVNGLWFLLWVVINIHLIPGILPFDPFPFGLLTMIVSLEAIFLSIVVLISQNRGSKIDDIREEIGLQINTIAEEEITKMMELQVMILKKHGIDVSKDKELQQMLEPTDKGHIERVLEKQLK